MAAEQERQINTIFEARGGNDKKNINAEDLDKALKLLSEQLYTQSTHFIFELLQNADDNTYAEGVQPHVTFTLGRDANGCPFLRIDCNEVGFQENNVDAICRIAHSTKTKSDGFIGEKGIGFKSVFRVASEVYIASNGYTFKFDKHGRLGMVKPIWAAFPKGQRLNDLTQIYLKLESAKGDAANMFQVIKEKLNGVRGDQLIFLRQLKSVKIQVQETRAKDSWTRSLTCRTHEAHGGEAVQVAVSQDKAGAQETVQDMLVVRHVATDLPQEEARQNITTSEIVLAFPIKSGKPAIEDRSTYAFLPIGQYGFSFLIQADFLLPANRNAVDEGKKWNISLRTHVAKAFQMAVDRFLTTSLKHSWLGYLPIKVQGTHSFFGPLASTIMSGTSTREVLYSFDNSTLALPKSLSILPRTLRIDGSNVPFFKEAAYLKRHLSDAYSSCGVTEQARRLGVSSFGQLELVDDLSDFASRHREVYVQKAPSWHLALAKVLRDISGQYLRNIPLIPLREGTWLPASSAQDVHFQSSDSNLPIPPGVAFQIVDPVVGASGARRELLSNLGVRSVSPDEVYAKILHMHNNNGASANLDHLISQTRYIFKTHRPNGWSGQDSPKCLKLKSTDGMLLDGKALYVDLPDSAVPKISETFAGYSGTSVQMLDPRYTAAVDGRDKAAWLEWLQETLEVSEVPRLVRDRSLSPEMSWLLKRDARKFLNVFGVNKDRYIALLYEFTSVRKTISSSIVKARNGTSLPLKETFLPTTNLVIRHDGQDLLPYLDLTITDPYEWDWLSSLRVTTSRSLSFWLRYLKICQGLNIHMKKIPEIYEGIKEYVVTGTSSFGRSATDEQETIKAAFSEKPLVYLPDKQGGSWHSHTSCVWRAPEFARLKPALASFYPELGNLFETCLGVGSWSATDLFEELRCVSESKCQTSLGELERLQDLLLCLPSFLRDSHHGRHDSALKDVRFPTRVPGEQNVVLRKFNELIVPDRLLMKASFGDRLPWLDLGLDDMKALMPVLEYLDKLQPRSQFLSNRLTITTKTEGDVIGCSEIEESLRSKSRFLRRLADPKSKNEATELLRNIQVLGASLIWRETTAEDPDGSHVQADAAKGKMSYDAAENRLYLLVEDLQTGGKLPTFQLARELCDASNIQEPLRMWLFEQALRDVGDEIADVFECFGFGELDEHEGVTTGTNLADFGTWIQQRAGAHQGHAASSATSEAQKDYGSLTNGAVPSTEPRSSALMPTGYANILQVAQAFDISSLSVISSSAKGRKRRSRAARPGQATTNGGSHSAPFSGAAFDMQAMQSALSQASTSAGATFASPPSAQGSSVLSTEVLSLPFPRTAMQVQVDQDVGYKGELFMHHVLNEQLKSFWSPEHWTSHLRSRDNHSTFDEDEADFADFTFADPEGQWTRILIQQGAEEARGWLAKPPTYHIEVKATLGPWNFPFSMSHSQVELSHSQVELARDYTIKPDDTTPEHVYIIARVFNVNGSKPNFRLHIDPWRMYISDQIRLIPQGSYEVRLRG